MIGNLSKRRGVLGEPFKYKDFTPEQLEGLRGPQGVKGDIGNTPSITFEYNEETGELFYNSDGILVDKDYVDSNNLATKEYVKEMLLDLVNKAAPTPIYITLYGGNAWEECGENMWCQEVDIDVTEYSKVDLQPDIEQLAVFHKKDLAFVTENDNGKVTVYCIGQRPADNYTIQATVMEVTIDG